MLKETNQTKNKNNNFFKKSHRFWRRKKFERLPNVQMHQI